MSPQAKQHCPLEAFYSLKFLINIADKKHFKAQQQMITTTGKIGENIAGHRLLKPCQFILTFESRVNLKCPCKTSNVTSRTFLKVFEVF